MISYIVLSLSKALKFMFKAMIYLYIYTISPILPNACVHEISCSKYCLNLFKNEKLYIAIIKSLKRILTCHPFNKSLR